MDHHHVHRHAAMLIPDTNLATAIDLSAGLLGDAAAAHGPPQKDETTVFARGGGSKGQSKTERLLLEQGDAHHKRFSMLRASLALKGWGLRQKDGVWWITKELVAAIPLAREQGVQA